METITVIGMDPSMSNWGFARATVNIKTLEVQVEKIWTQRTEKTKSRKQVRVSSDDLERARTLADALKEACQGAHIAMVELPHGSQSASGMKSYGICLGVLAQCELPLIQMSEQDLKLRTVGKKTATKAETIAWAFERQPNAGWKLRNGTPQMNCEHEADAVAAIHAGLQDEQFQGALTMLRYMKRGAA